MSAINESFPAFLHIKDLSSKEYKQLLHSIDTKLDSFKNKTPISKEEKEWIQSLNDWFDENHRLVDKDFKNEPAYKSPINKVQEIIVMDNVYYEVIELFQSFIDSPETIDKREIEQYYLRNSFLRGHPFSMIHSPLTLIDFNNVVFDYSKIRENIEPGVDVQDLTLFGHIFHAPIYREIYNNSWGRLTDSGYPYRLTLKGTTHPIENPDFNINQYTIGQRYMLYLSLSKENKKSVNEILERLSKTKLDNGLFNYILQQVEIENPIHSQAFSSLYESIELEKKKLSIEDIEKKLKLIMDVLIF